MNFRDDKFDVQSDDSAASADSGVILNDRLMSNNKNNRCNIDISTSVECDNSLLTKDATINIENIINFAKNVSPTNNNISLRTTTTTASKKATPSDGSSSSTSAASSLRSTRISITSIHSDASSSVIDSDCDVDDFEDTNQNIKITKLGHETTNNVPGTTSFPCMQNDGMVLLQQRVEMDHNMDILSTMATSSITTGNAQMTFTNSSDITIGQKNYYQGPVTIQQFLIENQNRESACLQGSDNSAFVNECPTPMENPPHDQKNCDVDKLSVLSYKLMFNRRAVVITTVIMIVTILIGGIFASTSYLKKHSSKQHEDDEESRKHIPVESTIGRDNIGAGSVLRFVTRDEWLARPESEELTKLNLPVHRVIIAHTATEGCKNQAACSFRTQSIQSFHMDSRGYADIGYNFLVGGDGAVYEGRGWDYQGAHTFGFNVDSICIAFIGTFIRDVPPEGQLNATKLIIAEGVKRNKLVPDYRLFGARQLIGTESPGSALFDIIRKWPHWSNKKS